MHGCWRTRSWSWTGLRCGGASGSETFSTGSVRSSTNGRRRCPRANKLKFVTGTSIRPNYLVITILTKRLMAGGTPATVSVRRLIAEASITIGGASTASVVRVVDAVAPMLVNKGVPPPVVRQVVVPIGRAPETLAGTATVVPDQARPLPVPVRLMEVPPPLGAAQGARAWHPRVGVHVDPLLARPMVAPGAEARAGPRAGNDHQSWQKWFCGALGPRRERLRRPEATDRLRRGTHRLQHSQWLSR